MVRKIGKDFESTVRFYRTEPFASMVICFRGSISSMEKNTSMKEMEAVF
jgi:hypothetical protein